MLMTEFTYNEGGGGGGGGGQLIPGMGGMNPTGSDPLNPTATSTGLASSGLSGAPGNATLGGASGLMAGSGLMVGTPNAPIGTSVGDGGLSGNVGLIPGTTTPSGFPANTTGTVGGAGQSGIQNLDLGSLLGFNANDPNMISQLDNMFGKGVGAALVQFLSGGAGYNPAIGTALINQMAPQEERTRNQILESFGASGGRYSSPAAIGLADYESSYSLGQQGILANLASQATDRYSNLFGGLIDTAYLTQANKLSPWNIISGILGLAGSAGIKIPGVPGSQGPQGPQGQPGPQGPVPPQPPTDVSVTTGPQSEQTQPELIPGYNSSGTYTDPSTGITYDLNGNIVPGSYTGYGSPFGPLPGAGGGLGSGSTGYDWQDPTGGGGSTPTIPIDSSSQYTDTSYNDPGSYDFFDSWG